MTQQESGLRSNTRQPLIDERPRSRGTTRSSDRCINGRIQHVSLRLQRRHNVLEYGVRVYAAVDVSRRADAAVVRRPATVIIIPTLAMMACIAGCQVTGESLRKRV